MNELSVEVKTKNILINMLCVLKILIICLNIPLVFACALRGSFFIFVESGCISTNIEFTVP